MIRLVAGVLEFWDVMTLRMIPFVSRKLAISRVSMYVGEKRGHNFAHHVAAEVLEDAHGVSQHLKKKGRGIVLEVNRGTVEVDDTNKVDRVARVTKKRVNVGVASAKTNHLASRGLVLYVVNQKLRRVGMHKTIHATKSTPVAPPYEIA